jgi:transcriptional regulator with XRE-family HTH domain
MKTRGSDAIDRMLATVDHQATADRLGVTRASLYTWRRGRGTPNENNRTALEKLFSIAQIDWFVPFEISRAPEDDGVTAERPGMREGS